MPKVPSFILKKLYVKNSLKNLEDGFQFEIKNVLADATINAPIELTVDNKPVEKEKVTLVIGGKEIPSGQVSSSSPLKFPVQTLVQVKIEDKPLSSGKHKIEIKTNSQEYGEISFSVKGEI